MLELNIKQQNATAPIELSASSSRLAILAPTGYGKTHLLNALMGFSPAKRSIKLHGHELVGERLEGQAIGYLMQHGSVIAHWQVGKQLKRCAAEHAPLLKPLLHLLPHNKRVHELSGGQQQLLALVCILARKPQLIIADEPFSALDKQSKKLAIDTLNRYLSEQKAGLILVSHQQEDLALCCQQGFILNEADGQVRALSEALQAYAQQADDAQVLNVLQLDDKEPLEYEKLYQYHLGGQALYSFDKCTAANVLLLNSSHVGIALQAIEHSSFMNQIRARLRAVTASAQGCYVDCIVHNTQQSLRIHITAHSQASLKLSEHSADKEIWLIFKASALSTA